MTLREKNQTTQIHVGIQIIFLLDHLIQEYVEIQNFMYTNNFLLQNPVDIRMALTKNSIKILLRVSPLIGKYFNNYKHYSGF